MTSSPVDDIKNKLDLVEIIGGYIRLQKAGRNYRACCPFHSEKTPSFMVSPEKQIWHCFGCGKGGSVFDFIMEMDGLEFGDALKILAQRAGIELKKIDSKTSANWRTEKTQLYEICDLASRFFIKQLEASRKGKEIQAYLAKRGLKSQTIKDWQIGYAPNQWEALSGFLKNRGYSDEEILKTGLTIKNEQKRSYYDRFRDRIIFPIKNLNEVTVGFTGRENPNNPNNRMGKYINTPNTLIYNKSCILYGLDKAKLDIRKNDLCILVEGQMDVIMSHQAGSKNAVASSGTALTEEQLKIIKRYTKNLTTAFDMDSAGETATKRGINLAIQFGLNARVVSLPDDQDPADCLKNDTSVWLKAVKESEGLVEFYVENAFSKNNSETAEGKRKISEAVLPIIKRIPNRVEQAHWLQEVACRLRVKEEVLIDEMNRLSVDSLGITTRQTNNNKVIKKEGMPPIEEYTLGLILAYPKIFKKHKKVPQSLFTNSDSEEIFKALKKSKIEKDNFKNLEKMLPSHLSDRINYLIFKAEAQKDFTNEFKPEIELQFCFDQLKKRRLQQQLNQLNLSIREAESKKDKSLLKKLTEDVNKLSKQII